MPLLREWEKMEKIRTFAAETCTFKYSHTTTRCGDRQVVRQSLHDGWQFTAWHNLLGATGVSRKQHCQADVRETVEAD